ncbi:MAG: 4Fe-4S dicluster domain-containing protein [Anaerolineae bacterium]
MTRSSLPLGTPVVVQPADLQKLFDVLRARGYRVIGPTRREGAIVHDELTSSAELPVGWTDVQDNGKYRLERRTDNALFGFNNSSDAWKRYLNPPEQRVWQAQLQDGAFQAFDLVDEPVVADKLALMGVRPCDLRAIAAQDRVLLGSTFVDPAYKARRENIFIVAVNCSQASGSCFCTSFQTGPKAKSGYDLVLTEVIQDERHFLVLRTGTEVGDDVIAEVPHQVAGPADLMAAVNVVDRTAGQIRRRLEIDGLAELVLKSYENPMWDQVAARCMSCGNCTLVCPTCFCSNIEDTTDLAGTRAERWRKWDSCFNLEFSYIHGGSIRTSIYARYRQWMTHKLATFGAQFGTPGCVGCGRCITWCPAGIDITEQARLLQEGVTRGEPA